MNKKLNISKGLMYASVMVLVVFQAYWLRKVYRDTYHGLQREIAVVLRESFIKEQMQVVFGETNNSPGGKDTLRMNGSSVAIVSLNNKVSVKEVPNDSIKFQMHIEQGGDSTRKMPPARIFSFDSDDEEPVQNKLIITLPFSLTILESGKAVEKYRPILKKAGLPYEFTIRKSDKYSPLEEQRGKRHEGSNAIFGRRRINLVLAELDFGSPFSYIIGKMYGQILIALFMTGMVILAFRFMFKSLKDEQKLALLKNDFISNMTHELKTPIATVSVAIEALKNFSVMDNPGRTKEYLDISSVELNRLSQLIDKVLRINMFEAEKLNLDFQGFDLASLITEVVYSQRLQATTINGTIIWIPPVEPIMVKGDKFHLMSVLYNLLDNALKYRNDIPVIEISLFKQSDIITLKVKDNGPGIAPAYLPKIFEKFFRVPQHDRHDVKGYGLGLSYVQEVVQKHNGSILVESEPGKGCTFIVTLPAGN